VQGGRRYAAPRQDRQARARRASRGQGDAAWRRPGHREHVGGARRARDVAGRARRRAREGEEGQREEEEEGRRRLRLAAVVVEERAERKLRARAQGDLVGSAGVRGQGERAEERARARQRDLVDRRRQLRRAEGGAVAVGDAAARRLDQGAAAVRARAEGRGGAVVL